MVSKDVQFSVIAKPIEVTPSGIVSVFREVHSENALYSMVVKVSGKMILSSEYISTKASAPILVSLVKVTFFIFLVNIEI